MDTGKKNKSLCSHRVLWKKTVLRDEGHLQRCSVHLGGGSTMLVAYHSCRVSAVNLLPQILKEERSAQCGLEKFFSHLEQLNTDLMRQNRKGEGNSGLVSLAQDFGLKFSGQCVRRHRIMQKMTPVNTFCLDGLCISL